MTARVTASKKTPAKKPTPAPAALPARPKAPFEPLRLSSTPETAPEMVDLFEIDDVMYQVPRKPSASVALKYLDAVETVGQAAANLYVLREMLGKDGYEALSNCKTLEDEQLEWVATTVIGLVVGTVEAPKA